MLFLRTHMRFSGLALVLLLLTLLSLLPVSAANRNGLSFALDCSGFTSRGGSVVLNRNNAGGNRETIIISAIDGQGNTIFDATSSTSLVGSSITMDNGLNYDWTSTPLANPLILRISSPAGNGLAEELVYEAAGVCSTLPTVEPADVGLSTDGVPSESIGINTTPPLAISEAGVAETQVGYAIVNVELANLRSGDSPRYTVVSVVEGGTSLVVLGRNGDRSWWFVQVGETRGWINAELVLLRGDLTDVPLVPVVGEITRPTLFIHIVQPIYNAPGGSVLCTIEPNREYFIVARTSFEPVWYEIEASCGGAAINGWILGENGSFRNPGEVNIPFGL